MFATAFHHRIEPGISTSSQVGEIHLLARLPQQIVLVRLSNRNYKLRHPFVIDITRDEEGQTVVYASDAQIYGAGRSSKEALADFQSMLIDTFNELTSSETQLSEPLRQRLANLSSIVARR
jgi:hypothetical protein